MTKTSRLTTPLLEKKSSNALRALAGGADLVSRSTVVRGSNSAHSLRASYFSQVLSFSGVVNGLVELVTGLGLSVNALMIAMLLILLSSAASSTRSA